jgi:MYXO-CTERM domain-containing protein
MNRSAKSLTPTHTTIAAVLAALAICLPAARAQIVTLHDGNSSASVNLGSQAGMSQWMINGQNQLNQQWFWYRVGNSSGQHSIDTIGGLTHVENANSVDATYNHGDFSIELTYTLSGGAAGGNDWTSDITENITINNLTGSTLDFHFFQYSDFALAGSTGGETASIFQNGGFFSRAKVVKAANQLSETIDQPLANRAEADLASNTRDRLNGGFYNLNNVLNSGPDATLDATWALQWDFTIDPNGSVDVIKDKKLSVAPVPEPGAVSFALLGLAAFFLRRNRSRA